VPGTDGGEALLDLLGRRVGERLAQQRRSSRRVLERRQRPRGVDRDLRPRRGGADAELAAPCGLQGVGPHRRGRRDGRFAQRRPTLEALNLSAGKQTRLHRLLYRAGPANGTLMFLPYDHGIEHGPIDFFENPESADPAYVFSLAVEGRFSGVVTHANVARRYYPDVAGKVPLVVKVNGRSAIPAETDPFSPITGSVEEAVSLGADAVGYTLYTGSPAQDRDIAQLTEVRQECETLGMPLIVWSYPRGKPVEDAGGRDSLYAVDYAARLALELGADVIKINLPQPHKPAATRHPSDYESLEADEYEMTRRVVASAGRALVIFSGGTYEDHTSFVGSVEMGMKAGAAGIIAGRNMWQRPRA
jgi:class I fructose-bisphosphate aldolase